MATIPEEIAASHAYAEAVRDGDCSSDSFAGQRSAKSGPRQNRGPCRIGRDLCFAICLQHFRDDVRLQ